MHKSLALVALLLPLSGCVVPPGQGVYGYTAPAYPGGYYAGGDVYPGYSYNDGAPTMIVEGAAMPLIFFDGGWGYYDRDRRWHRAPERVWRQLEQRHPGGAGFRPYGGPGFARPEGPRPGGYAPPIRPEGPRYGGPGRPVGPGPGAVPGGFRPGPVQGASTAPRPSAPPRQAQPPQQHQGGGRHCPPGQSC